MTSNDGDPPVVSREMLRNSVLRTIEVIGIPPLLFKSLMVDLVHQIGGANQPMHKDGQVTAAGFGVAMAALAVGMFATRTLPMGDFRMRQRWSDLYGLLAFIRSRCDEEVAELFTGPLSLNVRRMGQLAAEGVGGHPPGGRGEGGQAGRHPRRSSLRKRRLSL
jgi:hypothetical protein